MGRRDNQLITYLSDEEMQQFQEWADDTDKSTSHLLREAVLEYLDHDRAARIEGELQDINDRLDDLATHLTDNDAHTHTSSDHVTSRGSRSTEKVRDMLQRLRDNHKEVIKADDVDRVIEDFAGADTRTLRKYKRLFRKRGLLFEHPGSRPLWTTDGNTWVGWMQSFGQLESPETVEEIVEQYPARFERSPGGHRIELQASEVTSDE